MGGGRRLMQILETSRSTPDPMTGESRDWTVELGDGRQIPWAGLRTGPRTLSRDVVAGICQRLLGFELEALGQGVEGVLRPATAADARRPALLLHSTTPELKTFEGDLEALVTGARGGDFTTYKEARSVYLARPGDLAVGRTLPWRAAVQVLGVEAVTLPELGHYYLSHALLAVAAEHRERPVPEMERLVDWVRQRRPIVRLYAFEQEMQIFLLWLTRAAGLDFLPLEANHPRVSARWNRKAVLHPPVAVALKMPDGLAAKEPVAILRAESALCELAVAMELEVPTVPGYTLERLGRSQEEMASQIVSAAALLRQRYGLERGCLKASESGDGARILPGLDLADEATLRRLAHEAWPYGDDYVLEAHVTYGRTTVAGEELITALSAHVRGAAVAPGATLQFMEGTSWKGNVMVDEGSCEAFGVEPGQYRELQQFLEAFHGVFERQGGGLVLAGVDFAVGSVGGRLGEALLLGVQDLNVSFTGAECLRAFLARARAAGFGKGNEDPPGVTRIYRPRPLADHQTLADEVAAWCPEGVFAEPVASIPGRWGMVGVTGDDPAAALRNLGRLRDHLLERNLIEPPGGARE